MSPQCAAVGQTSSSRNPASEMVGETVEKRLRGRIAPAARWPNSAASRVVLVESTDSGAAKTTNNEPQKGSDRGLLTAVPSQQQPARRAKTCLNATKNPPAKWPSGPSRSPGTTFCFNPALKITTFSLRLAPHDLTTLLRASRQMNTASESEPNTEFVTLADAAEQLGVHYMTAYRYVRTGRMMAEKRSGQWWVTPEDLAAVVAAGTGPRRRGPGAKSTSREMRVTPFTDRLVAGDTAGSGT